MSHTVLEIIHIVAVTFWMAGLLYLPRLFVYHSTASGETARTFVVMERRLLRVIMNPSMIVALLSGAALAWHDFGGSLSLWPLWLFVKLLFVLLLAAYHGFLSKTRRMLALGKDKHSARFYRRINELPALVFVVIVALVVGRPF